MAVRDFVIGKNEVITMDFYPAGLNDIKAQLDSVDQAGLPPARPVDEALSLSIYPNPTTEAFTAEVQGDNKVVELAIYDMRGSMVKNIDYATIDQNVPVSVRDIENGTYVVRARLSDGRLSAEQLVVQNE